MISPASNYQGPVSFSNFPLNYIFCFFAARTIRVTLTLCETNLHGSIDSGNFSVRGYPSLFQKDSVTHMYGLAVYVNERLPLAWDFSLENLDSYLCVRLALLHSVSYFFFLYRSPSLSLCMAFDAISSNIGEVLSIKPSANMFVFGDFNIYQKD